MTDRASGIGRAPWAIVLSAFLVLWSGPALSQAVNVPSAHDRSEDDEITTIRLEYGRLLQSDLDNKGNLSRDSVSLDINHRFELTEEVGLALQGGYQLTSYDFSRFQPPSGAPQRFRWTDIHEFRGVALVDWKINDEWSLLGAGAIFSHAEGQANFDEGTTYALATGFSYRANEDLNIGLLLGAGTAIENDATIFIVPRVDWRFAENWRWRVDAISAFGGRGVGTELSVKPIEEIEVVVGITRQFRRFRLDDYPAPNGKRGVGEESSVPAYVRLVYRPIPRLVLDASAGVVFAGDLQVEDFTGDRLQNDSYDPTAIFGVGGTLVF